MRGAQVLVQMLLEYGVEVVFGVPGDTSLPFYEAIHDARQKITHVMARDERSAGFMADAYARISFKPGICECPNGAGALYSIPGIAEANASSIPVILFTSDISLADEGRGTITALDHHKLFEPVTKWSSFLKQVEKIPETVRRCFRVATTGRPGTVHLAFPNEVLTGEFGSDVRTIFAEPECVDYPAYRTRGGREVLEEAVRHLLGATRPVIIAGGGANHSRAGEEIRALSEWLAAPVVTTISGQGIMPDDHPLALGVVGDNGFHPYANEAVEEADLLLYVGCKRGSVSTIRWTLPTYKPDRRIIQIDLDPVQLSNNFANTLGIAGDANLVLKDLIALLTKEGTGRTPSPWVEELNGKRERFWEEAKEALESEAVPIKPQRIINALNKRLPPSAVVIADAGTPTPYITRFLKLHGNSSRFLIPRAFGGLGYAIPAAVGVHLASRSSKVVALFGDGSLGMSMGELETLVRLEIPAVLIHFNNGCFGWIKALQALHCGGKFLSVDFTQGDMARVAEALGLKAFHIESPEELERGLDEAFASPSPVFLDVVTECEISELPPVYSWLKKAEDNRTAGRER